MQNNTTKYEKIEKAKELLRDTIKKYKEVVFFCSFGKDSMLILHLLKEINANIKIFYINTGYEFDETIKLKEKIEKEWNIKVKEIKPEITKEEFEKKYGKELYKKDPTLCCEILKVEPTKKALNGVNAWVTGLRKDETEFRKNINIIEKYDNGLIKINPLADWRENEVWEYIKENNIPYNELYDRGYRSLGCIPCTKEGKLGQFERAGRWIGTNKHGGECGIHTFLKKVS